MILSTKYGGKTLLLNKPIHCLKKGADSPTMTLITIKIDYHRIRQIPHAKFNLFIKVITEMIDILFYVQGP